MADELEVNRALRENVNAIVEGPVTSEQVDTYGKLREIEDKSKKARVLLDAWERQHNEERNLRKHYAAWLLFALLLQMLFVNLSFFLIGIEYLKIEQWVAQTFIVSVFGEIAAMVFWIVKFLFPKVSADVLTVVEKL